MPAIWRNQSLGPVQHRVLWWLIDAGLLKGRLPFGWMRQCSLQLGMHRTTLRRNVQRLVREKVLLEPGGRGVVAINPKSFEGEADARANS